MSTQISVSESSTTRNTTNSETPATPAPAMLVIAECLPLPADFHERLAAIYRLARQRYAERAAAQEAEKAGAA